MRIFLFVALLIPIIARGQKRDFEGVYAPTEIKDQKVRLKPWDTIREVFTFTSDSFKYSYAVMRPNGRVAVSVDYDEYGAWSVTNDTTLSEPDKLSGQRFTFQRTYASLDEGRIVGWFESAFAADSLYRPDGNSPLVFVRNKKVFTNTRKPGHPLKH